MKYKDVPSKLVETWLCSCDQLRLRRVSPTMDLLSVWAEIFSGQRQKAWFPGLKCFSKVRHSSLYGWKFPIVCECFSLTVLLVWFTRLNAGLSCWINTSLVTKSIVIPVFELSNPRYEFLSVPVRNYRLEKVHLHKVTRFCLALVEYFV